VDVAMFCDVRVQDIPNSPQTVKASVEYGKGRNYAFIKARSILGFMDFMELADARR